MSDFNPYQSPAEPLTQPLPVTPPVVVSADKIGGWLYLVAIGIAISPFRLLASYKQTVLAVFSNGGWENATTIGSAAYHPLWAPLLVTELVVNALMSATWIYMNYLFFSKKKGLPKWYVSAMLFTLAFMIFDMLMVQVVRPDSPLMDPDDAKELARLVIGICIWVPYMLTSDRVKRTFTR
jgi:uncharacterized membrane protein YhdT